MKSFLHSGVPHAESGGIGDVGGLDRSVAVVLLKRPLLFSQSP